nr:hypothetical protein [uncultured Rhodopila sp.]
MDDLTILIGIGAATIGVAVTGAFLLFRSADKETAEDRQRAELVAASRGYTANHDIAEAPGTIRPPGWEPAPPAAPVKKRRGRPPKAKPAAEPPKTEIPRAFAESGEPGDPWDPSGPATKRKRWDSHPGEITILSGLGYPLEIRYRDSRGRETNRPITAERLAGVAGDDGTVMPTALYAFCELRNAVRSFLLARIIEAVDGETGEVLPDLVARLTDVGAQTR